MNEIIYSREELTDKSDEELLAILASSWGLEDNKFEIYAELPPLKDAGFAFLRNPRLIKTGERLYYPLKGEVEHPCSFFIGPKDISTIGSKKGIRFIRCQLDISPKAERIKHNNPFELNVKPGTAEPLSELPKTLSYDMISHASSEDDVQVLISKAIYDFYFKQAKEIIDKKLLIETDKVNQKLSIIEEKVQENIRYRNDISYEINQLLGQKSDLEDINKKLQRDELFKRQTINNLIKQYSQVETDMNNKIKRLKSYIEDKAAFLKTFEFIDEEDLDFYLKETQPRQQSVNGISFSSDLNGDYQKAVHYIQAHLVKNNILYPRHIIENYLTLLRTKDLIILAGDSGSGKTNLVKSFAKAVGGKAIIVPVKPNWTSSEDLLGYYNPLEKKYLSTPFLEALLEAKQNPEIPYFICLDEMNLARVEYYFADFLSLLETRDETPEIVLYTADESAHVLSELKAVVDIIQSAKEKYKQDGIINFIELLKDEQLNNQLRLSFGFSDKDSLIKYHSEIRRMLSAVMSMPSAIKMPANVHIIGAINIDETTHYLSPKILDRAHIMRFESPLLSDWDRILQEVEDYPFENVVEPLIFDIEALGKRTNYPSFERADPFCKLFTELNKEFFHKLGIEFGMRTIRQGLNYLSLFKEVNSDYNLAINNFLLHKVWPKFTFDGNKSSGMQTKLELIEGVLIERIKQQLPTYEDYDEVFSAVSSLENLVHNAKVNDGIVNFWS
ncbi:McrB family protein [Avibacterium avium]|uniref:McrB family protein n=3 Tax=Avibacterium avium TaxID=751 RepID=UPI003BF8B3C6